MPVKTNPRSRAKGNLSVLIPELDRRLLEQCGFDLTKIDSVHYNQAIINKLSIRQLDRLKMLLLRSEPFSRGVVPKRIVKSVSKNNPKGFAEALARLKGGTRRMQAKKHNSPHRYHTNS
jgi:hypothetical protein